MQLPTPECKGESVLIFMTQKNSCFFFSEEICRLQVLSNDGVQDYPEDHLDVGGVCCRGEVGINDLALVQVTLHELSLDEPAGRIHVTIRT